MTNPQPNTAKCSKLHRSQESEAEIVDPPPLVPFVMTHEKKSYLIDPVNFKELALPGSDKAGGCDDWVVEPDEMEGRTVYILKSKLKPQKVVPQRHCDVLLQGRKAKDIQNAERQERATQAKKDYDDAKADVEAKRQAKEEKLRLRREEEENRLKAEESKEAAELEAKIEAAVQTRLQEIKQQHDKEMEALEATLHEKHEQHVQRLMAQHAAEIVTLKAAHEKELKAAKDKAGPDQESKDAPAETAKPPCSHPAAPAPATPEAAVKDSKDKARESEQPKKRQPDSSTETRTPKKSKESILVPEHNMSQLDVSSGDDEGKPSRHTKRV